MKLKEIIFVVEEDPEGGYTSQALGYSIFTEAETLEELKENIKDAIKCHFDKIEIPLFVHLHIIKEERLKFQLKSDMEKREDFNFIGELVNWRIG